MQKRESKFSIEVQKWMRSNYKLLPRAFAWEAKIAINDNALPFDSVKEHQISALEISKWHTFVYKISDLDQMQKPCDGIYIHNLAGLLFIHWYKKNNKEFFIIDIDVFIQEKETSKRKSLTEDRAREIAMIVGELR